MDVRSPAVRPSRPTTTTPGGPKEEVRRFSRPLDFWRKPPPHPPACPPTAETPVVTPSPPPSRFARGETEDLKRVGAETRSRGRGRGVRADATPPRHQHKAIREMGFDSDPPQPTPTQTPSVPPSLQSKAHFPQELPARKRTYTKMYKDVCLEYIYMKHETRKGKF